MTMPEQAYRQNGLPSQVRRDGGSRTVLTGAWPAGPARPWLLSSWSPATAEDHRKLLPSSN